ncbi:MAG: alpha/beta hydrolase, partial [Acidobacteriota bacterium]
IVQSSFTHIRDAAKSMFPTLPIHLAATRQFRSIDKVGMLSMPKLFIHGESDETFPYELGRALFESAAEPKELYSIRGAGHTDVHRHGGMTYLRKVRKFCRRSLRRARKIGPS